MRKFIEITESMLSTKAPPKIISIEIKDDKDITPFIANNEYLFSGKKYIIRKIYCYHDENPVKPCTPEIIKEVK